MCTSILFRPSGHDRRFDPVMKAVGETKNRNHRYRNTARSGEAICCLCCRYGCKHGEMHEIERVGLRAEQAYRAGRRRRQTANSQRGWKAKSKTESGDGEEEYVKGVRRLNHCSTRMAAPTPTSSTGRATSGLWCRQSAAIATPKAIASNRSTVISRIWSPRSTEPVKCQRKAVGTAMKSAIAPHVHVVLRRVKLAPPMSSTLNSR